MLALAVIFNLATANCFHNTMSSPLRNSTSIVSDFNHDQLSLEIEDTNYKKPVEHKESWKTVLLLAYQSLGVVYGDLSVAPLYVYQSTFAEDIEHSESNDEIFGVLSFVFWTFTLIPLLKYVFIVFRADDNGEGGTFALYSLLCRYAKVGFLPNSQVADRDLSAYKNDHVDASGKNKGFWLNSVLEKYRVLQIMLLVLTLFGACMVIGDGILTPSILVTSAVTGFNVRHTSRVEDVELFVACSILVCVFVLQHYGTHRVGSLFAPIIMIWLLCIGGIGVYNIYSWNHQVYRALNPRYMHKFLNKTGKKGWLSLGGILLCVTGSEAMFSNLGHFSQLSIKIAFTLMVYPCSILSYMGQGAYLSKSHSNEQKISLYLSVPPQVKTPFLVISILAAAVGSQTIVTGTFSIIKQCSALGCFPRVKVIHTSSKVRGQVYIPEVNWILMLLCLAVIIGFRDTTSLSNASGLAVITVMLVTTCLMFLVIVICWNQRILVALGFFLFFGSIEGVYISASVSKFSKGAWAPIAISSVVMTVMCVWHYGTIKKYEFDVQNKVSLNWLLSLGPSLGIVRVPGIGIVHTDLVSGIPAIFSHFVMNLPAFHQVLVFLCVKSVPVPHVQPGERFLIGRLGPKECRFYRCIVRYGYREVQTDGVEFERDIILSIAEFIRSDPLETKGNIEETMTVVRNPSNHILVEQKHPSVQGELNSSVVERKRVKFMLPENSQMSKSVRDELQVLMDARESGMAFIVGRSRVRAQHQANPIKKIVIDVGYDFLRRNSRDPAYAWSIPHISTLEVGMVYLV